MFIDPIESKLTRIGVFYDGGYFQAVSDYYKYYHPQGARLSIQGVHGFAEHRVAAEEGTDERYCHVVDAHYFRGRFGVESVIERNQLENERRFDDVLMRAGVVTHYLPRGRADEEKGIDVWFALEAYELAIYKRFNVLALLACDGDYVPLVRKLNTLGTRVMLLGWDFKYADRDGRERETRTAQSLIDEVTYYIPMHSEIENNLRKKDPVIDALFYRPPLSDETVSGVQGSGAESAAGSRTGVVQALKDTFGFIVDEQDKVNHFFHCGAVAGVNFAELSVGDRVLFVRSHNDKGMVALDVRLAGR